jgi:hypothetical protein
MTQTIWKFPLAIEPRQVLLMPGGARVLHVGVQANAMNNVLCLWALVDQTIPTSPRHFDIFGTGHEIPPADAGGRRYIGTAQMGQYVWHVFERVSIEL